MVAHHYGEDVELRALPREDAGGISYAAAEALLGYTPTRSWRDYLTEDGILVMSSRTLLEKGETGVQRGRAALS